jgi:hypothetical protein
MARVILDEVDTNYIVSNSNVTITGSDNANESVIIELGVTGVKIDAAIETVELAAEVADFTYKANGTVVEVYRNGQKVIDVPANPLVNGDARKLAFTDGRVDVAFGGGDSIELGGVAVPDKDSAPKVIKPIKSTDSVTTAVAIVDTVSGVTGVKESFVWTQANAVGHSTLTNFGVTEDAIQFDLAGTERVMTTLDKLNSYSLSGEGMISVSLDQIKQETIIGLGNDSQGQPLALTLVGVTDASQVDVSVI